MGLATCRLLGPGQLISKDFVELSNMHYIYIIIMHFMHHTVCMCVVCMYVIYIPIDCKYFCKKNIQYVMCGVCKEAHAKGNKGNSLLLYRAYIRMQEPRWLQT